MEHFQEKLLVYWELLFQWIFPLLTWYLMLSKSTSVRSNKNSSCSVRDVRIIWFLPSGVLVNLVLPFTSFLHWQIIQILIFRFFFSETSWTNDEEPGELSDIFLLLHSCFLLDKNKTLIIFLFANETWNQNQ